MPLDKLHSFFVKNHHHDCSLNGGKYRASMWTQQRFVINATGFKRALRNTNLQGWEWPSPHIGPLGAICNHTLIVHAPKTYILDHLKDTNTDKMLVTPWKTETVTNTSTRHHERWIRINNPEELPSVLFGLILYLDILFVPVFWLAISYAAMQCLCCDIG